MRVIHIDSVEKDGSAALEPPLRTMWKPSSLTCAQSTAFSLLLGFTSQPGDVGSLLTTVTAWCEAELRAYGASVLIHSMCRGSHCDFTGAGWAQQTHGKVGLWTHDHPTKDPLSPSRVPGQGHTLPSLFQALKRQSLLGLSFFNSILAHGDLRNNKLNQLSVNLWHLAQRHGCADTRTMVSTGALASQSGTDLDTASAALQAALSLEMGARPQHSLGLLPSARKHSQSLPLSKKPLA